MDGTKSRYHVLYFHCKIIQNNRMTCVPSFSVMASEYTPEGCHWFCASLFLNLSTADLGNISGDEWQLR